MYENVSRIVGVGGFVVPTPPTTMPTTQSRSEFHVIPLKFTLMGISNDIPRIRDFRDAAMGFIKGMLTTVSYDIDGLKITEVKERYIDSFINGSRGLVTITRSLVDFVYGENATMGDIETQHQEEDDTRVFNFYYDVTVVSDSTELYGPLLIDAVRRRHPEILQQIQEYRPTQYYYAENFDLCTTTTGKMTDDDRFFDLCSQDHQMVSIKFGALALPEDMDRDLFTKELMQIYQRVLNEINGLEMTGMYADEQIEEVGRAVDFYFDVNVIRNDQDMKFVIENKVQSQDGRMEILYLVQNYTNKEGRDIEWCITDAGRFSAKPCAKPAEPTGLPLWIIITIAATSALLVIGCLLWILIVTFQRRRDEDEFKNNCRKYVTNPEDFYRGQCGVEKSRRRPRPPRKHRGDYGRVYARPSKPRYRREERRNRHHSRRRRYRSSGRRERHDSDESDPLDETLSDSDDNFQLALCDNPRYPKYPDPRHELLQLPPTPHQQRLLQIEAQYPTRLQPTLPSPQRDMLQIEGRHPLFSQHPLPQSYPQQRQKILENEGQHPTYPGYPRRQFHSPPAQQEPLQIKHGPVYCDDEMVNQPDPMAYGRQRHR
eukprot:CCRYP_004640-RA/>CCRYP_004640-RA protein AED:0.00 eAED:0.00 QI:289/1/1/1/0/0/2/507/598